MIACCAYATYRRQDAIQARHALRPIYQDAGRRCLQGSQASRTVSAAGGIVTEGEIMCRGGGILTLCASRKACTSRWPTLQTPVNRPAVSSIITNLKETGRERERKRARAGERKRGHANNGSNASMSERCNGWRATGKGSNSRDRS